MQTKLMRHKWQKQYSAAYMPIRERLMTAINSGRKKYHGIIGFLWIVGDKVYDLTITPNKTVRTLNKDFN